MKKAILVIAVLVLFAVALSAANPWPAKFTVINKSDQWVIISMDYPYSWLTVPAGTTSEFHIERGEYDALVTACGETVSGTMNLKHNLKLTFTRCEFWSDPDSAKFPGEPSQEKPNWNNPPKMPYYRFQY